MHEFAPPLKAEEQDESLQFRPKFGPDGLIAAIAQDVETDEVLMLAWMNEAALTQTIRTGRATYWSRSREALWVKGESSGHTQEVADILVDCDQDAVVLKVRQHGAACHTGRRSCFYRRIDGTGGTLSFTDAPD